MVTQDPEFIPVFGTVSIPSFPFLSSLTFDGPCVFRRLHSFYFRYQSDYLRVYWTWALVELLWLDMMLQRNYYLEVQGELLWLDMMLQLNYYLGVQGELLWLDILELQQLHYCCYYWNLRKISYDLRIAYPHPIVLECYQIIYTNSTLKIASLYH